jgi:hypothetical protein
MSEQSEDMGRALYDAYCHRLANAMENHRYRGKVPIAWHFLTAAEKDAWRWAVGLIQGGDRC